MFLHLWSHFCDWTSPLAPGNFFCEPSRMISLKSNTKALKRSADQGPLMTDYTWSWPHTQFQACCFLKPFIPVSWREAHLFPRGKANSGVGREHDACPQATQRRGGTLWSLPCLVCKYFSLILEDWREKWEWGTALEAEDLAIKGKDRHGFCGGSPACILVTALAPNSDGLILFVKVFANI